MKLTHKTQYPSVPTMEWWSAGVLECWDTSLCRQLAQLENGRKSKRLICPLLHQPLLHHSFGNALHHSISD